MSELNGDNRVRVMLLSKPVTAILVCLRLALGWQFLYEGLAKLLTPHWTSAPYLLMSRGFFPSLFHWLGSSPGLVRAVDLLNIWGLIVIGAALILGAMPRLASAAGIVFLGLYYLAQPPLIHANYRLPVEGNYLYVNKNLVELLALVIFLILPADRVWGISRLLRRGRSPSKPEAKAATPTRAGISWTRRETLENLIGVPVLNLLGFATYKKYE